MKLPNSGFTAMAALSALALFVPINSIAAGAAKKADGTDLCSFTGFSYDTTSGVMTLQGCTTSGTPTPTPTPSPTPTPTNDTFAFAAPTYNVQSSATATTNAPIAVNFTRVSFPSGSAGGVYLQSARHVRRRSAGVAICLRLFRIGVADERWV